MKIIITSILLFLAVQLVAQPPADNLDYQVIGVDTWTNPQAFDLGPELPANGLVSESDSLIQAYDVVAIYKLQNEYYAINNWADYFYWFTKKISYAFPMGIDEYEFYYTTRNTEGMVWFVANSELYHYFPEFSSKILMPDLSAKSTDSWAAIVHKRTGSRTPNSGPEQYRFNARGGSSEFLQMRRPNDTPSPASTLSGGGSGKGSELPGNKIGN